MFLEREDMEEYMMSTGNMIHKVCRTSIKSRAYRDDEYIIGKAQNVVTRDPRPSLVAIIGG